MADALQWLGLVAASAAAAVALTSSRPRVRAAAMLAALALAPLLIAVDAWDTARFEDLRDSPARLAAGGILGAALIVALAALLRRRPAIFPLLAFAVLPFRVPVDIGGDSVNLLIPLYVAIGAGALAAALRAWRGEPPRAGDDARDHAGLLGAAVQWLPRLLAAFVVLYALQSAYSDDFSNAIRNACFFLIPFAALFSLLSGVRWDRRLLTALLAIAVGEALVFAAVGFFQFATRELFWNDNVIAANELHTYFRVNSLFWDPNVFGRYLVLVILAVAAAMLWERRVRFALAAAAVCGVLIAALTMTYSQSSLFALLAGLVALAALRWRARWALAAAGTALVLAVAFMFVAGSGINLSSERSLNVETSGRAGLVRGGLELAADRPGWGFGSGAFQERYVNRFHNPNESTQGTVSHTEPITVAAEQGVLGIAVWVALVAAGLGTLLAVGAWTPVARAALVACLVAMVVHSLAYAGFLIDPVTWALLGLGAALARWPAGAPAAEASAAARSASRSHPAEGQPSLA